MKDFGRGVKVGVCTGIIYGIISPIFLLISGEYNYLYSTTSGNFLVIIWVFGTLIYGIIFGIIYGLIFGLIYAAVYDKIPGTSSTVKGIILSLLLWLIFSFSTFMFITSLPISRSTYDNTIIITLLGFLLLGFLVGVFWDKFKPSETIA